MSQRNILNFLGILTGIKPAHSNRDNRTRFSLIGMIAFIVHFALCVHCDYKLGQEQKDLVKNMENISFGITYLQRVLTLSLPLMIAIGTILQFKSGCTFYEMLDHMDHYLTRHSMDLRGMFRRIRIFELSLAAASLLVAVLGVISCVYAFLTTFQARLQDTKFYTYYSGFFYTWYFLVFTFDVCGNLYCAAQRLDLFNMYLTGLGVNNIKCDNIIE